MCSNISQYPKSLFLISIRLISRIVTKRGDAITREMNRLLGDDKKMSKKEKDERILWKKNEVADYEATLYTIFYNNVVSMSGKSLDLSISDHFKAVLRPSDLPLLLRARQHHTGLQLPLLNARIGWCRAPLLHFQMRTGL
jgi:hypothetical protein